MQIIQNHIVYPSRKSTFNFIGLGDIHLGNVGCDIKKLTEMISWIKETPNTYIIGMGDYCEAIQIDDPRFDDRSVDSYFKIKDISLLINKQIEAIIKLLYPVKNKILGLLTGNHEETYRLHYHRDIVYEIAKGLNLFDKVLGYDGFIQVFFKRQPKVCNNDRQMFTIYATHGFGSARKSGSKVNRLEDFTHFIDADLILVGHEHKKIIAPPIIKLGVTKSGKLCQHKILSVMTGSFLRGYVENATTYIEKKCYSPCDLGVVKVIYKPFTRDIHASL